jgi:hypothetical protein
LKQLQRLPDGNQELARPLPLERIINDVKPTQHAVKHHPQDGMMDAPRKSDGKHAPETPKTNARTTASIFHCNSHMSDAGAMPEPSPQCHDSANQCCAAYGWHSEKDSSWRRIPPPQILRVSVHQGVLRQTVCQERRPMSRNARAVH